MLDCLPIHPQLHPEESITSWVLRLSASNEMPARSFLNSYLREEELRRRDLDLLDRGLIETLARLGRVQRGGEELWEHSLGRWNWIIAGHSKADHKSWIGSIGETRVCPLCLREDRSYLRKLWRLHFLPICVTHKVVLTQECQKCRRRQPLLNFRNGYGLARCKFCGGDLADTESFKPTSCPHLFQFTSDIEGILNEGRFPRSYQWPYSPHEFFDVLGFFLRLCNRFLLKGSLGDQLIRNHRLPTRPPFDWRKNDSIACVLLERALETMTVWPSNAERFLVRGQPAFNELASEYGEEFPSPLVPYRTAKRGNRRNGQISQIHREPKRDREGLVRDSVNALIASDKWIGPVPVSKMTGIDYRTLIKHDSFHSLIIEGRQHLLKNRQDQARNAVKFIKERGLDPSVRSVAAYLGRSTSFVRTTYLQGIVEGVKSRK